MKRILTLLFLITALSATAQNFRGYVFYQKPNGSTEPLPFAQVYYLERQKLIETDEAGQFTLNLADRATLVATYIGYTRDTVVVQPGTAEAKFYLTGENDLAESKVVAQQSTLPKLKGVKTEVITAAGLCKMACCALAESFENSASVTVGFSDAVTGARQIKLLGLSGTYTQMLDENRPVMRGIASPFGMSFVPGQWLESIQIAKGPSSVINGLEAITGQINMEHRKPTDETPLFVQLYGSSDAMFEGNIASAIQFNERLSMINMAHVGGTASKMDHNGDGFRDEPEDLQLNFTSRWLYYHPSGMQIRFGGRFLNDDRLGGQMDATKDNYLNLTNKIWGSNIKNRNIDGYFKIGFPLNEENSANIALVTDFNHHEFNAFFGYRVYDARQNSAFANLIYQNEINETHKIELGATWQFDDLQQGYGTNLKALYPRMLIQDNWFDYSRKEHAISGFGEYTLTLEDKLTFVGGVNLQYSTLHGWLFAPRANIRWSPADWLVLRALGGRGYRTANIFTDNLGIFSTAKAFIIPDKDLYPAGSVFSRELDLLEDAWTWGGNVTVYLPFGAEDTETYLSFDYFRNDFNKQVIVDYELDDPLIYFYNLDGKSYTNTYQVDFSVNPLERFNITATFRYTDAKVTLMNQGLVERPMTSRFKGVLNMQYATAMNKWTFDFTAQLNGPMRLPKFAAAAWGMETSPVYPMFYAQITRKFKGFDVYVGAENIGGYRQHDAIIGSENPLAFWSVNPSQLNPGTSRQDLKVFDASSVWGPLMGRKFYIGLRYTLWK
ncbi:MAG: TonB-dependent receptor [Bacteroidales bacterium]|nr:TonB-dependent receptor [Bacteroidales bacterium]